MLDAMLALLAKEPAHGYELRQRLVDGLGPAGEVLNPGQVYVTLGRLVRTGLVRVEEVTQSDRPDKKVYELTVAGRDRVRQWLDDVSWPKVAPTDFHLKLVAAAQTGLADPVSLVDAQRRELLRRLRDVQQLIQLGAPGRPRGAAARGRGPAAASRHPLAGDLRTSLDREGTTVNVIESRGLCKSYPADGTPVRAVDDVDLVVAAGEAVSVMGPSGCGKSTLLHLLGGLERPDSGELHLAGREVQGLSQTAWAQLRRRHVGFVFQAFHLVDELTAVENVELPALLLGSPARAARRKALELLDRLGVADRADRLPHRMSGGQQQRVALARALVNEPVLVLADEPTGSLDSRATGEILALLAELRDAGQTLLLVTHDPRVATTAQRLLTMRDGAIVEETQLGQGPGSSAAVARLVGLEG